MNSSMTEQKSLFCDKFFMLKLIAFILFWFLLWGTGYAQELKMQALNRITLNKQDTLFEFYVKKPSKKNKVRKDANYHWFKPDTILITQGGYSEKLLDGSYKVYYPNKNLKEQGSFSFGVKKGVWKNWYPDGKLQSIVNWREGRKEGSFSEYDVSGDKVKSGKYKNDLLSGDLIEYQKNGKKKKFTYKKGFPVIKNPPKEKQTVGSGNEKK